MQTWSRLQKLVVSTQAGSSLTVPLPMALFIHMSSDGESQWKQPHPTSLINSSPVVATVMRKKMDGKEAVGAWRDEGKDSWKRLQLRDNLMFSPDRKTDIIGDTKLHGRSCRFGNADPPWGVPITQDEACKACPTDLLPSVKL